MRDNDEAVIQASDLWKQGQKREAMRVLVQRVEQLVDFIETMPAPRSSGTLRGFFLGALTVLIVGAAVLFVPGYLNPSEDYDPAVQEWWSYNAGTIDEFYDSLGSALLWATSDLDSAGWMFIDSMNEADALQEQFESASYPFKVKEARDNILRGMTEYQLMIYGIKDEKDTIAEGGELSAETQGYAEQGHEHMRNAAQQITALTGEDASFLVLENTD